MKTKTRKISLPQMHRSAHIDPVSIDREKRTVDVIWTTGQQVLRRGFFEDFVEELSLEKDHVRMERLQSGRAPVLDNHGLSDKRGVLSTIGVVESAELIPGKEGRAKLRFSKRADVDPIFQDIEDKIIRNISVGYITYRAEVVGETKEGLRIIRAIDWEPGEISPVPAGADSDSFIRSKGEVMTECVLIENVVENTNENRQVEAVKKEPENKSVEIELEVRQTQPNSEVEMTPEELEALKKEAREQGIADENTRQLDIRALVKKVRLEDSLAETYITENKSVDEVRTLVIDAIAEKDAAPENDTRGTVAEVGTDLSRQGRIEGMESALLHRFRPKDQETRSNGQKITLKGYELVDAGREYAYRSLVDMARICLEANGIRTGMMANHQIVDIAMNNRASGSAHSTSDFPEILANVANKTLRNGYLAAPQTFKPFTSEVFVSDFKEISRTNLGDAPKLERLQEGSEVKRGTLSEAAEKYRVEEYARVIALTRKTIVNDDLGAFTRLPERMGRRAADLESDTVWDLIKANDALADGFALFSANHNNLSVAPAAPSEAGFSESRASMRRQTGLDGAEISLTPVWVFVPPEHETTTEKLLATTRPTQPSETNPFGPNGRTTLIMDVEPRLETGAGGSINPWYMTADKGQIDMIELARLEGTEGPQIQTRDGFDVNGVEIKIMHDIGAKAIDHRGMFKNSGA